MPPPKKPQQYSVYPRKILFTEWVIYKKVVRFRVSYCDYIFEE